MSENIPQTGDWYTSHGGGVFIEVGEIDPEGNWAMIHVSVRRDNSYNPPGEPKFTVQLWDKQQPLNFPGHPGRFPDDWVKITERPDYILPWDESLKPPRNALSAYRSFPGGAVTFR